MATLYRKYRPINFIEVVGQNYIKITLQNEIQSGNITHAYLFCGPRAVGKTTMARVFSKSVNCLERKKNEFEPCNKCAVCQGINSNRELDIIEIDAASHTGVDNVRENIIASARVAPSRCKYKIFIIDEVHMLSISAFNALLKIIEEPPSFVIFILCTTEVHKVPNTIISRCQRFDFRRININDIVKKLNYIIKKENIKINKNILETIARQSEGYMRDAESLLGQIVSIGGKEITEKDADLVIPRSDIKEIVNLIGILSKKDSAGGVRLINKLLDDGVDLKTFVSDLIEILRKVMLSKINSGLSEKLGLELGENLEKIMNVASKNLSLEQLICLIENFIKARNKIKESHIPQLPIELAIIELCMQKESIKNIDSFQNFTSLSSNNIKNTANKPNIQQPEKQVMNFKESDLNSMHIADKWNEVLAKIKKYNHSLSFILRACVPGEINDNGLRLIFKYKFHKERINDPQIKTLVEKVLNEVYGKPLVVESVVDENLEINNSAQMPAGNKQISNNNEKAEVIDNKAVNNKKEGADNMINDIIKTFGGKVVE